MQQNNPLLHRMIKQTLYDLKLRFGSPVSIYRLVNSTTDYRLGTVTATQTSIDVKKCVVLPANTIRDLAQSISYISANKPFVWQGDGGWDENTRVFIFEGSDLRDYEILMEDWIIYRGKRFDIANIEQLEHRAGWAVMAKEVVGSEPDIITQVNINDDLGLDEEEEEEVE